MNSNFERTVARFLTVAFITSLATNFAFGEALIVINDDGGNNVTTVGGNASTADTPWAVLPTNAMIFGLSIDTMSDILIIDAELSVAAGEIYLNDPHNVHVSHTDPPLPFFGPGPDWWITTPGGTSAADASRLLSGERVSHFDTTNNGPQTDFQFASFALIPDAQGNAEATLNAWIQTAAQPTPVIDFVSVTMSIVPEPDSGLLAIAALFAFAIKRRTLSKRSQR